MGIRALCAAAAVVVGVGSAAEAATAPYGTYDVEMTLFNIYSACNRPCEDPLEIPYAGMSLGDTQRGTLVVKEGWDGDNITVDFRWAGGVLANNLGLDRVADNAFYNTSYFAISFTFTDGLLNGTFTGVNYPLGTGDIEQLNDFLFSEVAPVPLPATAALLPLGLGALALLRRRRRRVS